MGRPRTQPAIMAYLTKHPGKSIKVEDLQKATGLELTQIQAVMLRLSKDPARGITVLNRGSLWRYQPEPEDPAKQPDVNGNLYEAIGRTSNGATIVRDTDGILYVLKEIRP